MKHHSQVWRWARVVGGLTTLGGVVSFILAPLVGEELFSSLRTVEPLTYIGAVLVIAGLTVTTLSFALPPFWARGQPAANMETLAAQRWSEVTQQYFEVFNHDLGRPLRRILGKERELRAFLQAGGAGPDPSIKELLDEIEAQVPNFRLMMSNIQVLVQLEASPAEVQLEPIEPGEVVRRIVDRYTPVAGECHKEITWWSEPQEFGIVMSSSSAIEHIVVNLVDNAVRYATLHIEIKLSKNPTHFFVRVWDDGPGIAPQYMQHVFDRGWTPEVAHREEKTGSGLGLYIARSLARRYWGEVTVQSVAQPDAGHHTAFLLSLPLGKGDTTSP